MKYILYEVYTNKYRMAACNICAKTVEEIYTINSYSICRLCLQNGYRNIDRKRYKDKDIINKLGISYCNTCKCIKDLNEFVNVKNHYYKCNEFYKMKDVYYSNP